MVLYFFFPKISPTTITFTHTDEVVKNLSVVSAALFLKPTHTTDIEREERASNSHLSKHDLDLLEQLVRRKEEKQEMEGEMNKIGEWLFNIFMDGCMREMKAKVGIIGARMKLNGVDWSVTACLFTDDTVLVAESERGLQRVVDQFHSVCSRRKLRVNAGKTKVMVFERKDIELVNFGYSYRVSVLVDERCEIVMTGERMEVVK